jgi:hypothetical protein
MFAEPESLEITNIATAEDKPESTALRVFTWFSVGIAVATVGIFVGREIVSRYKFKRRTPYDFYANAGEHQAGEFGVGI